MFLSTPRALRLPTVKRVLVPRTVRRKTNLVPAGRTVVARGGRTAVRTVKRTAR